MRNRRQIRLAAEGKGGIGSDAVEFVGWEQRSEADLRGIINWTGLANGVRDRH